MTVLRGLAALVLTCAVCAAGLTGARGEFGLSADEEDRASGSEDAASPSAAPPGLEAVGRISTCPEEDCFIDCSGFLIGPDLAATAAHCVKNGSARGSWHDPGDIRFHSFTHPAVRAAEYVHTGDHYHPNVSPQEDLIKFSAHIGQDIVILRLEERLGDKLGWLPKGKVDWDELAGGGEYEVAGVPSDKLFHLQSCRMHLEVARLWTDNYPSLHSAFENGVFFHTCYLRGGFSGGPLLRRENGKLTWIGVNAALLTFTQPGSPPIGGVTHAAVLLPNGEPAPHK
ncbi:MAG: trypsin-like serine peptidase [Rhodospirillales bacterium]